MAKFPTVQVVYFAIPFYTKKDKEETFEEEALSLCKGKTRLD